jgi:CheY-like chemotaxis protein
MGGALGVQSELNVGSTFWFSVRLEVPAPAPSTRPPAPIPLSEDMASRALAVLVVEDNAVNREVAKGLLQSLGCRVESAADGLEAVEACARMPYDVVLMDCQMPHLDGYEATRRIRALEVSGHRTAVIGLTASAMSGDRERCLAAGMDDYLPKPVRPQDLEAVLRRWGGGGQAEEAPAGLRHLGGHGAARPRRVRGPALVHVARLPDRGHRPLPVGDARAHRGAARGGSEGRRGLLHAPRAQPARQRRHPRRAPAHEAGGAPRGARPARAQGRDGVALQSVQLEFDAVQTALLDEREAALRISVAPPEDPADRPA